MLRLTMVCSASTMLAPATMGSTVRCGCAAWPPRPVMRMSQRSAAASSGPPLVTMWPSGTPGLLWMAKTASQGNLSNRPSSIIDFAPAAALFGRLEDEVHGAFEVALLAHHLGRAQQHGGVAVMATGVHTAGIPRAMLEIVGFIHRQAVHVGAQSDRLQRIALAQGSDDAGLAQAAGDLEAPFRQAWRRRCRRSGFPRRPARDGHGCRGEWRQSRPGFQANEEERASRNSGWNGRHLGPK